MENKLIKKLFFVLFSFVFVLSALSQDFNRVIELKNPRMNGLDVLALQKRLFKLSFYELGEADGYYGTMTEGVIKKIQEYYGLSVTGIVDKELWDLIFLNTESGGSTIDNYLPERHIYHRNNLERSINFGGGTYGSGDYYDERFVYYTLEDKQIKIIDSKDERLTCSFYITCYFFNENDCRIEFTVSGTDDFMEEYGYEIEGGNIYYLINDVLYKEINDKRVQRQEKYEIIDRINAIKNEFNARYR